MVQAKDKACPSFESFPHIGDAEFRSYQFIVMLGVRTYSKTTRQGKKIVHMKTKGS